MQKEILKKKIKENYGKIALKGNVYSCCGPQEIVVIQIIFLKNKCYLLLDIMVLN